LSFIIYREFISKILNFKLELKYIKDKISENTEEDEEKTPSTDISEERRKKIGIPELSKELEEIFYTILKTRKEVKEKLVSADKHEKFIIYLTNFIRYSITETDRYKLFREVGNFLEYILPQNEIGIAIFEKSPEEKIITETEKREKIKIIKGEEFLSKIIDRIEKGTIDEEKEYTSFALSNGEKYGFIVVRGELDANKKNLLYLTSKLTEAILKRIETEEELKIKAITDPLTGIYNRRYFMARLEQNFSKYRRTQKNYVVAIFDIDKFKSINDKYGHTVGDEILKKFSFILKQNVRGYDIPARFGGDEFVLLLDEIEKEESLSVIRRITGKFSLYQELKAILGESPTVSWGLCAVKEADSNYEEIIKVADKRLIKAKHLGGNQGVWE
jgi:diguanylate cyclase (GGDEF)-like protein